MSEYDLNTLSDEEFKELAPNFNIPYIGKLYTNYDKVLKYRKKLNYYESHVKVKDSQAHRPADSCK